MAERTPNKGSAADVTAGKQRGTPFRPGQSGNPAGRPVGARSKLGEAFLADLLGAWENHGADAIGRVLKDRPQDFLKVIAQILPREVSATVSDKRTAVDWTSDELLEFLLDVASEEARAQFGSRRSALDAGATPAAPASPIKTKAALR